jgi:uncharacterized protein
LPSSTADVTDDLLFCAIILHFDRAFSHPELNFPKRNGMTFKLPAARDRILSWIVGVLVVLVTAALVYVWFDIDRAHTLVLAAGGSDGESYILAKGLATVVERHYPHIHVVVRETGGTTENLALLAEGRAELATAQADVPAGPMANLVAVLYRDDLQVFVRGDAHITDFRSLRGKRIGLPQRGGQYQSFLAVAALLGLTANDFRFVGADDASADRALLDNRVDAVFRVRTVGNPALEKLAQTNIGHFIPIEERAALKIRNPAFETSMIPQGVYGGISPQPPVDIPTVGVPRTLVARRDTPQRDIYALTSVLFNDRREIADEISEANAPVRHLLADVKEASALGGLAPPVHPGANQFFNRDKPAFILDHASFVGLLVTLSVLLFSWVGEFRRTIARRRKTQADRYTDEVIQLLLLGQRLDSPIAIAALRSQLVAILTEAVRALDHDEISNEAFQSLGRVWQIVVDLLREHVVTLETNEEIAARLSQTEFAAPGGAGPLGEQDVLDTRQ